MQKTLIINNIDTTAGAYRQGATDEALAIICELQDLQDKGTDPDEILDRLKRMEMRLRSRYQVLADHRAGEQ